MSEKGQSAAVGCLITLLTLPCLVVLRGFATRDLWHWFVVPLGPPPIGLGEAIGLSLVVAYFTYQPVPDPYKDEERPWLHRIIGSLFLTGGCWAVGWLIATVSA